MLIFQNSLTKLSPTEKDSPGRSGARFLNSWDKKFVVKTILSEEVAEMHRILKEYHQVCNASVLWLIRSFLAYIAMLNQ